MSIEPSKTLFFKIPGRPQGYVAMTHKGRFSERATKYHAWQERVKELALAAGWRYPRPTFERQAFVETEAYYPDKRGVDGENVRKGVVDALFPSKLGGDKFVHGRHGAYRVDAVNPRVEVWIVF